MGEIASQKQCSFSQIAISWLLSRPALSTVISGVRTLEQLDDNLGASELVLSNEQIKLLDQVSEPASLYPYRFIQNYAMR